MFQVDSEFPFSFSVLLAVHWATIICHSSLWGPLDVFLKYFKKNWFHHLDYRLKQLKALLDYFYNPEECVDSSFSIVLSVMRWAFQGRFFWAEEKEPATMGPCLYDATWWRQQGVERWPEVCRLGVHSSSEMEETVLGAGAHGMLSPMTGRQL